jgi:hypothetical protein
MINEYGAVGGIIGRGNRSTRRKSAPVPFCPPQIPHDLTWDRTQAAVLGSQLLLFLQLITEILIFAFILIKNVIFWGMIPCTLLSD